MSISEFDSDYEGNDSFRYLMFLYFYSIISVNVEIDLALKILFETEFVYSFLMLIGASNENEVALFSTFIFKINSINFLLVSSFSIL